MTRIPKRLRKLHLLLKGKRLSIVNFRLNIALEERCLLRSLTTVTLRKSCRPSPATSKNQEIYPLWKPHNRRIWYSNTHSRAGKASRIWGDPSINHLYRDPRRVHRIELAVCWNLSSLKTGTLRTMISLKYLNTHLSRFIRLQSCFLRLVTTPRKLRRTR